jgi:integral membrane sensor domain MASE1
MTRHAELPRVRPGHLGFAMLVALGYYAGARVGFELTFRPQAVSTLWLPNAILMAALALSPPSRWWILLLAVLPAHLFAELGAGVPVSMVAAWYLSNTLEALLGASLLRWRVGPRPRLDGYAGVLALILCGSLASVISSFVDATFVVLNGWGDVGYWEIWRTRTLSNVLAMVTVAPVVLTVAAVRLSALRNAPPRRFFEAIALAVLLVAASFLAFAGAPTGSMRTPALLYAPLPFLLWAAIRFGPVGAS